MLFNRYAANVAKICDKTVTRYALRGVAFYPKKNQMAASDGKRLMIIEQPQLDQSDHPIKAADLSIPKKTINRILNYAVIESVIRREKTPDEPIDDSPTAGSIHVDEVVIGTWSKDGQEHKTVRVIDSTFPDIEAVKPKEDRKPVASLMMDARLLAELLLSMPYEEKQPYVQIDVFENTGAIRIRSKDLDGFKGYALMMPLAIEPYYKTQDKEKKAKAKKLATGDPVEATSTKEFCCEPCKLSFPRVQGLAAHNRFHHPKAKAAAPAA